MQINSTNRVSFRMAKFSPALKQLAETAKANCKNPGQLIEYSKCVSFLESIYPKSTIDVRDTMRFKPKNFMERIIPSSMPKIKDSAYIDDKLIFDVENSYYKTNPLKRFISFSNGFRLIKKDIPIVPTDKFLL